VRVGFSAIKNFPPRRITHILDARKDEPFADLDDLLRRGRCSKEEGVKLIKCGACYCFHLTRAQLQLDLDLYWTDRAKHGQQEFSLFRQ
jgi:DNA polymerase III alpha subunit